MVDLAVLVSVIAVLLPSPTEPAVYTAYSGPQRPDSDVATLELAGVDWIRIDGGQRTVKREYGQIKLLPGTHDIEWCTKFDVSFLVDPSMSAAYVAREKLALEANRVYIVDSDRNTGPGYLVFFWIEDAESHDVVAGFKKPSRLLPGQVNAGLYTTPIPLEHLYGSAGRKGVYSKDEDVQMFYEAALAGNRAEAEALLSAGVDVNVRDRDGATVLIRAARENRPDSVDLLMDLGADVNARLKGNDGSTALIMAASNGYMEVVQLLLRSPEIDVNASSRGLSALGFAIKAEESAIRDLLLAHPDCDESVGAVFLKKNEMALALEKKVEVADLPDSLQSQLVYVLQGVRYSDKQKEYCSVLKVFIKRVKAKKGEKISPEDADAWVSEAESIRQLACTKP